MGKAKAVCSCKDMRLVMSKIEDAIDSVLADGRHSVKIKCGVYPAGEQKETKPIEEGYYDAIINDLTNTIENSGYTREDKLQIWMTVAQQANVMIGRYRQ